VDELASFQPIDARRGEEDVIESQMLSGGSLRSSAATRHRRQLARIMRGSRSDASAWSYLLGVMLSSKRILANCGRTLRRVWDWGGGGEL